MKSLALFGVSCLTAFSAWSYSIYVNDETGDDERDGTTPDKAVKTIQKGVDLINKEWHSPREVVCAAGTYKLEEPIRIYGGTKICSATGNPMDVIIDGQGKTRCAWTRNKDNTASDWNGGNGLIGVTVCNGYVGPGDGDYPAGVYMSGGILSNCVVRDCLTVRTGASVRGGAIKTDGNETYGISAQILDTLVTGNVISNVQASGSAASISGAGIYPGDGGGLIDRCVISNNLLYCRYPVSSDGSLNVDRIKGGGIYMEGDLSKLRRSVVCCNVASNDYTVGHAGTGGGVCASVGHPEISDCLIYGNVSSASGGGVHGSPYVARCTIRDNVVNQASATAYVGGAGAAIGGGAIVNSVIRGNVVNGTSQPKKYCSGGIWLMSPGVSVRDCVIEENKAKYGGALSAGETYSGRAAGVVSNCLIRCNVGTAESGVINIYGPDGLLVTDCSIVSNTATFGSILCGYTSSANVKGITFRNCYFAGNTNAPGTWVTAMFAASLENRTVQPLRLEYCTVATNFTADRVILTQNGNYSNVFIKGSVFFGNRAPSGQHGLVSIVSDSNYAQTTNMWDSVSDSTGGVPTDSSLNNLCGTSVNMKFRDAAGGDYRPLSGSPLVDHGTAETWMGSGRKSGPHDMGDGTFTVTANGKYGVTLTRNNSHARLYNEKPDAGCFEWWLPPGALLLFR